ISLSEEEAGLEPMLPFLEPEPPQPKQPQVDRKARLLSAVLPRPAMTTSNSTAAQQRLPLLELRLPFPHHFPGLLRAMYTKDLDTWERNEFRVETVGPITRNVALLECDSEITMRCVEYFARIRNQLTLLDQQHHYRDMETVRVLYERAMKAGLLKPDDGAEE
ncbi:hypothetical protein EDD11_004873, partial [Mortierella claussenii]